MKRSHTNRSVRRHPCAEKALKLDAFGIPFEFKLPDENTLFKTLPGAICTLLLIVVVLIYAGYKLAVLVDKTEYSLLQETHQYFFDITHKFDKSDGFAIAATVTAFDGTGEQEEDPTIGELKFYIKTWDEASALKFTELKTKPCTGNLFDEDSGNGFYPLNEKFQASKVYMPRMKCIDEDYFIQGTFDNDLGANLLVVFEKCTNTAERTCKDEQTINEWMEFKYLAILQNEERYKQSENRSDQRVLEQSIVTWHALSPIVRTDYPQIVSVSEVKFQDIPYGVNFGQVVENVFEVADAPMRILVYPNRMQTAVTYEFSDTKRVFIRVDYGILDWLSDIGGLYEIIKVGSLAAVSFFIASGPQLFVTQGVIASRKDHQRKMQEMQPHLSGSQIQRIDSLYEKDKVQRDCCLFLRLKLGGTNIKKCCGLRITRKDRIVFAANKEMAEDFKINNLLLKLRTLEGIVREELSDQAWERKVQTHGLYYNQNQDLQFSDSDEAKENKSEIKFMTRNSAVAPHHDQDANHSDNIDLRSMDSNPESPQVWRGEPDSNATKEAGEPIKPPDQSSGSRVRKSPKIPP